MFLLFFLQQFFISSRPLSRFRTLTKFWSFVREKRIISCYSISKKFFLLVDHHTMGLTILTNRTLTIVWIWNLLFRGYWPLVTMLFFELLVQNYDHRTKRFSFYLPQTEMLLALFSLCSGHHLDHLLITFPFANHGWVWVHGVYPFPCFA